MQLNEFAEQVLSVVREKADGNFSVWTTTIHKNNGTAFVGITTSGTEDQAQPVVYLDGYYNMFIHSLLSLKEVSDTVYDVIMEHMNYVPDIRVEDLMNWERMKSKICVKLINAEQNMELLADADMPHRFYLDFAVVYYIKISENEDELETIDVKNKYLDTWGISEDELYRTGMENMEISNQVFFKNMKEVLPLWLQKGAEPPFPMYVLTNTSRHYGASVLLLKKELLKISQSLGNLIILPSSLHELIVLPENQYTGDCEACAEMVKNVNTSVVLPEDYLSDHVYTYNRDTQELKIAA